MTFPIGTNAMVKEFMRKERELAATAPEEVREAGFCEGFGPGGNTLMPAQMPHLYMKDGVWWAVAGLTSACAATPIEAIQILRINCTKNMIPVIGKDAYVVRLKDGTRYAGAGGRRLGGYQRNNTGREFVKAK